MSCMLVKHKDFIFKLSKNRKYKSKLLNIIKNSNGNEIKSIGELSYNVLNGTVPCNKYRKRKLKKYANTLRLLANKKQTLKNKKAGLLKGSGVLLGTILPLAISTIAGLIGI